MGNHTHTRSKFRRSLALSLALAVATPAIVVPMTTTEVEAAAYSKTFKDVSKQNVYYDIIHTMAQQGIISGYEDGTFKPSQTINRKQAAALVNRAVKLPKTTVFKAPKDLSINNPNYNDIKALMEAGLLNVDLKGNINPNAPLTRGEMAKILTVAYGLKTSGTNPLKDVSSTNRQYVTALYNAGVTTGFEDNTFREKESLTRAHYAVFMYRANEFKENGLTLEDLEGMTPEETSKLTDEQFVYVIEALKHDKGFIPEALKGVDMDKFLQTNKAEFNKQAVAIKAAGFGYTSFYNNPTSYKGISSMLNAWSANLDMSVKEIVDALNDVYLEGKVITLGDNPNSTRYMVMYYDYKTGNLVQGGAIKK